MSGQLSIVIPVHNGVNFIDRCLESVVKASPKAEIIIVENGSSDNSWDRLLRWKDNSFALYRLQESNKCLARNLGATKATRNLLTFLDQDDELTPEISEIIDTLLNNENVDGVISTQEFDPEEEYIPSYFRKACTLNLPMYHPMAFVMRRRLFIELGGFESNRSKAEDFALISKFLDSKLNVVYSSSKTLKRHFHDSNDSHNIEEARRELFQVLRQRTSNIK